MPYLYPGGTAVAWSPSYCPPDQYISWTDLAREAGVPSWAHQAEYASQPRAQDRAQQAILDAYNRKRARP